MTLVVSQWVPLSEDGLAQPALGWAVFAWLVACLGVFFLARRLSGIPAALAALAISLVLPFAVMTSREDLLTSAGVACLIWYLYALHRWTEGGENWFWTLAAALLAGLAGALRAPLLFPAACGFVGLLFASSQTGRLMGRLKTWAILAGIFLLPAGFAWSGVAHPLDGLTIGWNPQVLQPWWLIRWLNLLRSQVDLNLILVSLLGLLLLPQSGRGMLLGAWLGYVLSGFLFSQDLLTNPSIHLVIVPLAALSLAPLSQAVYERILALSRGWQIAFSVLLILSLSYAIHLISA